jgi:sterol desaturase/sphingolipid hydroxylase (fatty acid hydroxylase superfamily)
MTVNEKFSQSILALFGSSLSDLLLYAFLALGLWLFFYVVFRTKFRHRRISQRDPTATQIKREILHSLRSIAIFGLVTGTVVYAGFSGWTRLYLRIDDYGWGWFVLSIGLMIVLHDAYFYWTHHALHHEKFRANFGLYFNVWDRLMGSNHLDYERRFDSATGDPLQESSARSK